MTQVLLHLPPVACRLSASRVLRSQQPLVLARGQHWCVFGGNGAGKSTLVKLLLGRLPQARSHVHYAAGFDPERDICEVSFEEQQRLCARDDRFDISEYSSSARDEGTTVEVLICGGDSRLASDEHLASILDLLDIHSIRWQGIRYLSSGQMRRAMIARALYLQPALLVLDNPLDSIDRYSAERIQLALRQWMSTDNCTLFLCRRRQQVLTGMTHHLLMADLTVLAHAPAAQLPIPLASPPSVAFDELPGPCAGRPRLLLPPGLDTLIELNGVSAAYGESLIFENLHFQMRRHDHVLLEGPNGCGKSTLLGLIDGDNHKAYGQPVTLFGRRRGSGESVWDIKARFGVVSNDLHNRYVKGWRVLDVVVSGFFDSLGLYDDSGASEASTARQWLQVLGLGHLAREYYHELSFGEQRLVLLARAMVKQPLILVLDEPIVGLDDTHSALLLAMVDRIAATGQTQILFVSHSADDVPARINVRVIFESAQSYLTSESGQQARSQVRVIRS
jgi:molybdate transport system ATP-binding protein